MCLYRRTQIRLGDNKTNRPISIYTYTEYQALNLGSLSEAALSCSIASRITKPYLIGPSPRNQMTRVPTESTNLKY